MRTKWYAKVLAVLLVAAVAAGLVAGCAAETATVTTTQTSTVTQTAPGATVTTTKTVGAGETVTVTAAATTVTKTAPAPAATVTTTVAGAATTITKATTVTKTVGGPTPTEPQVIKLRTGAGTPADAIVSVEQIRDWAIPEMVRRVAWRTNYRLEFDEFYGGSVAKLGELLEAIEAGILDLAIVTTPFESAKLFLHNFGYYIPFGDWDVGRAAKATRRTFEEHPELKAAYERYNQKWLATAVSPNYQLNTTFPVNRLADLAGRKIGGAGPNLPWLTGSGAVPVQTDLTAGYTSLQTGVYEGFLMFEGPVVGFRLYEIAKYFVYVDFGAMPIFSYSVNLDTWNSLPAEVQEIIQEVWDEFPFQAAERAVVRKEKATRTMQEAGVSFAAFPTEERAKWMAGLADFPNSKAQEIKKAGWPTAPAVFRSYIKNLEDLGFKFAYKYEIKD